MTDIEIKYAICTQTIAIIGGLKQLSEQADREACIYSALCLIKKSHPEAFEKALIFYLKEGVK